MTPAWARPGCWPSSLAPWTPWSSGAAAIAETLYITEKTASVHVSNILRKLGVSSRGEAAAAAYRRGLAG